jgi:hypothetical protein
MALRFYESESFKNRNSRRSRVDNSSSGSSTENSPKVKVNPNYLLESSTISQNSRQVFEKPKKMPIRNDYDFSDSDSMSFDDKNPLPNVTKKI